MNQNTLFDVRSDSFRKEIVQAMELMESLNIPIGPITLVSVSSRMSRTLGKAIEKRWNYNSAGRKAPPGGSQYEIRFSSLLLEPDFPAEMRLSTIYHELCHTIPGCMNHGSRWLLYAGLVTSHTGIEISRLADPDQLPEALQYRPKRQEYRYLITCTCCDFSQKRKQMSKVLRNLDRYECPRCHGKLKLSKT